jgi:hypothetical protein
MPFDMTVWHQMSRYNLEIKAFRYSGSVDRTHVCEHKRTEHRV